MGLAWTGEDEMETVVTAWEASAAFAADAEEAIVAALFASLVEALYAGQVSGNDRTRWAEDLVDANGDRCAPVVAQAIMRLASEAHIMRREIRQVANGPTNAECDAAADGDVYDLAANLEPAH